MIVEFVVFVIIKYKYIPDALKYTKQSIIILKKTLSPNQWSLHFKLYFYSIMFLSLVFIRIQLRQQIITINMFWRTKFLAKYFFRFETKNLINRNIKQSKSLENILQVFNADHQNFDSLHHLFFIRKYFQLNPIKNDHTLTSISFLRAQIKNLNNTTFINFFKTVLEYNLDMSSGELIQQAIRRTKRFDINDTNVLMHTIFTYKANSQEFDPLFKTLIKNVNLAHVTNGHHLVNYFQNINRTKHVSVTLNKGIFGKLSIMNDWHQVRNYNIILKTIINSNLEQNVDWMYNSIAQTCQLTLQIHDLVILALYLSKLHQPNTQIVTTVLNRIKFISRMAASKDLQLQGQFKQKQQLHEQALKQTRNLSPKVSQKLEEKVKLNVMDCTHILMVMNRLSLYDDQIFQIAESVFFSTLQKTKKTDLLAFLSSHRTFCTRLLQKVGIQNVDYNRRINNIKDYYNNFYQKLFTYMRTKPEMDVQFVHDVLKIAQKIFFTNSQVKDLAISLVQQKLKDVKIEKDSQAAKFLENLFSILQSYKRNPTLIQNLKQNAFKSQS